MGLSIIRTVVLTAAALSANAAYAICIPHPPARAFVGSDAACDYTTIQAAITAATDTCSGVEINIVPTTAGWKNQSLSVPGNRKITLRGWGSGETCSHLKYCTTTGCTFNQNPRLPIVPASGQSGLYVSGSGNTISISNIEFTGGSLGADHGGAGIAFAGSGSLSLDTVTIDHNTAGFGGGIDFTGGGTLKLVNTSVSGNNANAEYVNRGGGIEMYPTSDSVLILQGTTISGNTAGYGGGIDVLGNTTLYAENTTSFTLNSATYGGGGISLYGSSVTAYISSSLFLNSTQGAGGALDVEEGAHLNLFSTGGSVLVFNNSATGGGGAIDAYGGATVCAQDFSIINNTAADGAAILTYGSSPVYLNYTSCAPSNPPIPMTAVACSGTNCNGINNNTAQNGDGSASNGSVISLVADTNSNEFYGVRFTATGNTGHNLIYFDASKSNAYVGLSNCLMTGNTESAYAIYSYNPASGSGLHITSCTIADNSEGGGTMIVAPGDFALNDSILYESNSTELAYIPSTATVSMQYDLIGPDNYATNQGTTPLVNGTHVIAATPTFVQAGDYHLLPSSPGVDFSPDNTNATDLDGNPRIVDLSEIPDQYGPMDLGAYEVKAQAAVCYASDTIFCNGFEH